MVFFDYLDAVAIAINKLSNMFLAKINGFLRVITRYKSGKTIKPLTLN